MLESGRRYKMAILIVCVMKTYEIFIHVLLCYLYKSTLANKRG